MGLFKKSNTNSTKGLTAAEIAAQSQAAEDAEIQQAFEQGITTLRDLISPSSLELHSSYFRLGTKYGRTIYVYAYPRTLYTGWISPLINIDEVSLKPATTSTPKKAKSATLKLRPPSTMPKSSATNSKSAPKSSSVSASTLLFGPTP